MIELIDKDLKMEDLLNWLKGLHDFIGVNEEFERIGLWDFHQALDETINIVEQLCKGEWISVFDMMPAIGQPVLVVDSQKRVCIRHLVSISAENKLYWSQDKTDITHWMPLPEPPTE